MTHVYDRNVDITFIMVSNERTYTSKYCTFLKGDFIDISRSYNYCSIINFRVRHVRRKKFCGNEIVLKGK